MKRAISAAVALAVAVICMLAFCLVADAHSGRTDAQGGHYDRSTGEYHYHHGYSAHQHPNGICPYDDEVKDTAYGKIDTPKKQKEKMSFGDLIIEVIPTSLVFGGLVSLFIYVGVSMLFEERDLKLAFFCLAFIVIPVGFVVAFAFLHHDGIYKTPYLVTSSISALVGIFIWRRFLNNTKD